MNSNILTVPFTQTNIMPVIIASSIIVIIAGIIFFIYKQTNYKAGLNFLTRELEISQAEKKQLLQQEINYIQKIEQLTGKVFYYEQLVTEFEKLRLESKEATKAALFDLGNELSKQLIDIHKKENKEYRELAEQNIQSTGARFNSEFERLVSMVGSLNREIEQSKNVVEVIKNSLLSPSGAGKLAEITLENILKSSGLRHHIDFVMQYHLTGADNNKLRPDAVIFLPSDNIMVIDAKASKFLVDYNKDLQDLTKTMNFHLSSLGNKDYADHLIRSRLQKGMRVNKIVTLMFVPTEQAIEKIIESDKEFLNKAWGLNIFPVGPTGLMNMLSFARFQISEQLMLINHQQITEEIKKIINSICSMAEYSNKLGTNIANAMSYYDKFAASFNRNFLSKIKNINRLGIDKTGKNFAKPFTHLNRYNIVPIKSTALSQDETSEPETPQLTGD